MDHGFIAFLIFWLTTSAWAQTATTPLAGSAWPQALSLPWNLIGIDPARAAPARAALNASEQALANACLSDPAPLTKLAEARQRVPLNARRLADRIQTGALKGQTGLVPVAIEPMWSSLRDYDLLTVTVVDAARQVLLGSAHAAVATTQWPRNGLERFLSEQLTSLSQKALAQAASHPLSRPEALARDALHLGISLGREAQRYDQGHDQSLNLLLEEALAPRYTVVRSLGLEALALVRQLLGLPSNLRRPTRTLVVRWAPDPEFIPVRLMQPAPAKSQGRPATTGFGQKLPRVQAPKPSLPTKVRLTATLAETVHGEHLTDRHQSTWEFAVTGDGRISFSVDPKLETLLAREQKSLLNNDMPQAVKIDRAYVYVDRGRAWGLKIGDRLLARIGNQPDDIVKGHIVQYFGPELKLTSARGFPIQEGAVVFIRKNQAKAQVGMIFEYDPQTYPAPWPPRPP